MNINRPWPTIGIGWLLALVAVLAALCSLLFGFPPADGRFFLIEVLLLGLAILL